jgi:hypothetical protein
MRWHRLLVSLCLVLGFVLVGCLATVVQTRRDYVLVRAQGQLLIVLDDQDPLYAQLDAEILSDPALRHLLTLFGHATEGYAATNMPRPLPQAVANKPIIVVESVRTEVLRHITVQYAGAGIPVETALAVEHWDAGDTLAVRQKLAPAMASWLLDLMGLKPESSHPQLYEVTTPSVALRAGFSGAVAALYGQQHPEILLALKQQGMSAPGREWLAYYEQVPANELRMRYDQGLPTSEQRSRQEALLTPGVVATFFYRLLAYNDSYYPQRYMLWFTNFDGQEIPYSKVLLAINHMPRHGASVPDFIASYADLFPLEARSIRTLADQVFGLAD